MQLEQKNTQTQSGLVQSKIKVQKSKSVHLELSFQHHNTVIRNNHSRHMQHYIIVFKD